MYFFFMNYSILPNQAALRINEAIEVKINFITENDFIPKICIHFFLFKHLINKTYSLYMVGWQKSLRELDFMHM